MCTVFLKWQNYGNEDQMCACQGLRRRWELEATGYGYKRAWGILVVTERSCILTGPMSLFWLDIVLYFCKILSLRKTKEKTMRCLCLRVTEEFHNYPKFKCLIKKVLPVVSCNFFVLKVRSGVLKDFPQCTCFTAVFQPTLNAMQ